MKYYCTNYTYENLNMFMLTVCFMLYASSFKPSRRGCSWPPAWPPGCLQAFSRLLSVAACCIFATRLLFLFLRIVMCQIACWILRFSSRAFLDKHVFVATVSGVT